MFNKEVLSSRFEGILEHISAIKSYTEDIKRADDLAIAPEGILIYDAVLMRLQAIGENLKKIESKYSGFLEKYPEAEWNNIIRLRDIISHHYEKLAAEIIFE